MVNPCSLAKRSAPWETIITCGLFSITAIAALIGFFTVVTPATAPALRVLPSIIEASSSFLPSWVKTAPLPALKRGESSITLIDFCTASILVPPLFKTAYPAFNASASLALYSFSCSGVMVSLVIVPAPPWITRRIGACVLLANAEEAKRVQRVSVASL